MVRRGCLILCLFCLGCHSLAGVELAPEAAPAATPATLLWEEGQAAMRDALPEQAILCYERSLAADPAFTCNYLSLAAAYLECGKEGLACDYLAKHLEANP